MPSCWVVSGPCPMSRFIAPRVRLPNLTTLFLRVSHSCTRPLRRAFLPEQTTAASTVFTGRRPRGCPYCPFPSSPLPFLSQGLSRFSFTGHVTHRPVPCWLYFR